MAALNLEPERVAEGVWRFVLPSQTLPPFEHTNSYLVQRGGEAVLIDVGSADPVVLGTLATDLKALGVTKLKALLLTHTHPDHCAGAAALKARYGADVYVHALEHARLDFPAEILGDGDTFSVGGEHLLVYHTPGHSPGHLSFSLPDTVTNTVTGTATDSATGTLTVFVGDLLAAEGSTWVGLPEGNVSDYLASLKKLGAVLAQYPGSAVFGPGHGLLVRDPERRLEQVRAHRLAREAEILAALTQPLTLPALRKRSYPRVPAALDKLVEGTLRAHLDKLLDEGRVVSEGETFRAAPRVKPHRS